MTTSLDRADQSITSTLPDGARDSAGEVLRDTLVDLIGLALVGKQTHWNVIGRQFHDVHLHLDELVDTARGLSDGVAERCAAIGLSPDGRPASVAQTTGVPECPAGWVNDHDAIGRIFHAVDTVVRRLRPRIETAGKADPLTEDLLICAARALEESRWMWQARLSGYQQMP
jgi:starvation-inducible DNA-binding protein